MSASASAIGHGALGVRSALRTFDEGTEQSYCERRASADLALGFRVPTTWNADGTSYFTTFNKTFDGVPLEAMAVVTSAGENLIRVETIADCKALVSSFYFSPGGTSTLYVHLLNNVDPGSLLVRIDFLRRFGTVGSMEPLLGPDKSVNPGLNVWTNPTTLDSFTADNVAATGITLSQLTSGMFEGTSGARITPGSSGLSAGTSGGASEGSMVLVSGAHYVIPFAYRTHPQLPSSVTARVRVKITAAGANYMLDDGRNTTTASDGIALAATGGEWRLCLFVFRAPQDSTTATFGFRVYNGGGSAWTLGWVDFDAWRPRRIYRYEYVEPRLAPASVPDIELAMESPFPGSQSIGLGQMQLLNSDNGAETMSAGYFETLLSDYDIGSRTVQFRHGVTFDNGQETPFPDWSDGYNGTVQSFEVTEATASFALQNVRALMAMTLPVRNFDLGTFPNMATADVGRIRSPFFGFKSGIRPTRIDYDPTTFLPVYEVTDPTDKAGNVMAISKVYIYTDQDAADRRDTTRRIDVPNTQWSENDATGRITITGHPGPFVVVGAPQIGPSEPAEGMNDAIDVTADGSPLAAFVAKGLYSAASLASAAQTALGVGFTVTYSTTTHKFTINYTGISLNLNISSGANKHRTLFQILGFDGTADLTGSLSYTSTTAVYGVDRVDQFFIRVDATGMQDDAGGSYTGTASAQIEKGPDLWRFLLLKVLKRSSLEIDSSITAARTTATQKLGVYFTQQMTVQDFADRIEHSCGVDLVSDGAGKFYWKDRPASAGAVAALAASAPILYDRDFLADPPFTSMKTVEDTYPLVRLTYDEDPATGELKTYEVGNGDVEIRHGVRPSISFPTWLRDIADVGPMAWNRMLEAVLPRRWYTFAVKGRLMKKLLTDVVVIQRTRRLGPELTGMANDNVFRIVRLRVGAQTHTCTVTAWTADLPRVADILSVGQTLKGAALTAPRWWGPAVAGIIGPSGPGRVGPSP